MQPNDRAFVSKICPGCERLCDFAPNQILCTSCKWILYPGRTRTSFTSLFRYEGLLRDFVLQAKVHNRPTALAALVALCKASPATQLAMRGIQYVMPAPSSLWGRIHGKADIPWHVAQMLSHEHKIPFLSPPFALRWRWSKQAHRKRDRGFFFFTPALRAAELPTLLVVDDVATSGETLRRVAAKLESRYRVYFLVLADAGEWW